MNNRSSGILLHISSLPSQFGIGDLGPHAYQFVDFLEKSKQHIWQILPLNPTDGVYGHSPYSSNSAFAANPLFISPELMVRDGWLIKEEINTPQSREDVVDFEPVIAYKNTLFDLAYQRFKNDGKNSSAYQEFCREEKGWLDDYALFLVVKKHLNGLVWTKWPQEIKNKDQRTLESLKYQYGEDFERTKFLQFVFFKQWTTLKSYCRQKNVTIMGDVPIYVNDDSVDVWMNPQLFKLNQNQEPEFVAGVPPDYFSTTGQRWGNPVYDWGKLQETRYTWWIARLKQNFKLFDVVRIDHFRGLIAYWEIPQSEKTAINGKWVTVPSDDFLSTIQAYFPEMPIVAEDLGIITPDVTATMNKYDLPGMKILLFAFDGELEGHPYIPENYTENCVVYTGTHDNNTVRGWFETDASEETKEKLFGYIGHKVSAEQLPWEMIALAMNSLANTTIFPVQDVLALGPQARMNIPGTTIGNWKWRMSPGALTDSLAEKLAHLTQESQRS